MVCVIIFKMLKGELGKFKKIRKTLLSLNTNHRELPGTVLATLNIRNPLDLQRRISQ